jgi:hypothetical protein
MKNKHLIKNELTRMFGDINRFNMIRNYKVVLETGEIFNKKKLVITFIIPALQKKDAGKKALQKLKVYEPFNEPVTIHSIVEASFEDKDSINIEHI